MKYSHFTCGIMKIGNVRLRYIHDFISTLILTVSVAGLIFTGQLLGIEEGANFVRLDTKGFAKDQHQSLAKIWDAFDLRMNSISFSAATTDQQ